MKVLSEGEADGAVMGVCVVATVNCEYLNLRGGIAKTVTQFIIPQRNEA